MQRAALKDRQANYHYSSYLCSSALHMLILDLLASRRKSLIRSLDIYDFTAFKPCGKMLLGNVLRFTVAVDPILVMKSLRSLLAFFYSTYLSTLRPCSSLTALECRRNSQRAQAESRAEGCREGYQPASRTKLIALQIIKTVFQWLTTLDNLLVFRTWSSA